MCKNQIFLFFINIDEYRLGYDVTQYNSYQSTCISSEIKDIFHSIDRANHFFGKVLGRNFYSYFL